MAPLEFRLQQHNNWKKQKQQTKNKQKEKELSIKMAALMADDKE